MTRDKHMVAFMNDTKAIFQARFLDQMIKATFAASAEICNTILQFNDN